MSIPAGYSLLHDLGSNQEGLDGASTTGSPTDGGDYYTFDGNDGAYWSSGISEASIDIWLYMKLHAFKWGSQASQTFWKSGGSANGVAIGIDSGGRFGIFGRSSSSLTSITMPSGILPIDEWVEVYASKTKLTVVFEDSSGYTKTGSVTISNGSDPESVGYAENSCPIAGSTGDQAFTNVDIDAVAVYTAGDLTIPTKTTSQDSDAYLLKYHLGSNNNGDEEFPNQGTPTDNGDYYTFDGSSNGLYRTSNPFGVPNPDIHVKFRPHDKAAGAQVFWKSGGEGNGIAVGIDASGDVGVFGRDGFAFTSILISGSNLTDDVWHEMWANGSGVVLQNLTTSTKYSNTGTVTATTLGSDNESIGYSKDNDPITTDPDTDYFDGDVEFVELWLNGALTLPAITEDLTFSGQSALGSYSDADAATLTYAASMEDDLNA